MRRYRSNDGANVVCSDNSHGNEPGDALCNHDGHDDDVLVCRNADSHDADDDCGMNCGCFVQRKQCRLRLMPEQQQKQ